MIDPDQQKRFDQLCGAAFDDIATPEQLQELETMLQDDHWFEVYYHSVQIHATIAWELRHGGMDVNQGFEKALEHDLASIVDAKRSAGAKSTSGSARAGRSSRSMKLKPWYPFAAAVLILGTLVALAAIMLASPSHRSHPQRPVGPFASIVDVRDAVFEESDIATTPGAQVSGGFIRLTSGQVDLEFFSGARVTVTGPASFGINSAMRGFLEHGHIAVHCPEQAKGFTIGAPGVAIVDLGTRFTVSKEEGGNATVAVQEGLVRIEPEGGHAADVRQNQALVLDSQNRKLKETLTIPITEGRGFSRFIELNRPSVHDGVLVKNWGASNLSRIAFVRFDLSSFGNRLFTQSKLQMLRHEAEELPRDVDIWALPADHPEAQGDITVSRWYGESTPWKPNGSFDGSDLIHLGKLQVQPELFGDLQIEFASYQLTQALSQRAGQTITLVLSTQHRSNDPVFLSGIELNLEVTPPKP